MRKVCLIALLPWVLSCGWTSSLFSSAPAEGEEQQITVVAAEEPAAAAAPTAAGGEVQAASSAAESPSTAAASGTAATAASSAAQTSASAASTPPAAGNGAAGSVAAGAAPGTAATGSGAVSGDTAAGAVVNGAAGVSGVTAGSGTPGVSAAMLPPGPVVQTAPGPVTAISPATNAMTPAAASSGTAVGGVYSISPVSYGAGMTMAEDSRSRVERRKMKVEEFARRMDSLVMSRNFLFLPNSMQEFPGGGLQMIYNVYFYFGLCGDHVEVHLPTTRGAFLPYVEILNFDTTELTDYRCSPAQSGWNISFGLANGETKYNVSIYVATTTGETILTLYMSSATIRYVGYIKAGPPAA